MDTTSFDNRENKQRSGPWNKPWNIRKTEHARRKPDGGFRFIPALALMRAWWAYKQGIIRLLDLRVWLAIHETVSRRCGSSPNRFFRYTTEEIRQLVGDHKIASIQSSIQRLSNAGLLEWSERAVCFPTVTSDGNGDGEIEWREMVELVKNHRRKVPVPRRTLRFLAGLTRPVTIATVIGHFLRCLYYRNGMCVPDGRCKASWIADAFNVDVRNAKAARLHLRKIGLLIVGSSSQTAMNRWGASVRINLSWEQPAASGTRKSPPRRPVSRLFSPPPEENRKLSSRNEHQKPRSASPTGASALPPPNLRNVRSEDLSDPRRLDTLFAKAQDCGLVVLGTAARLRFHSAAAHAIRVGKQNPPGLFAAIVRRGLWRYVCAADEDLARRRLAGLGNDQRARFFSRTRSDSPVTEPASAKLVIDEILSRLAASVPDGSRNAVRVQPR